MKNQRFFSRLAAMLIAVMLLCQPVLTLAEEKEETITHIAKATVALKVRRAASKEANGCGSISRGQQVNIIEYGDIWSKVLLPRTTGWVQTKYLTDITPVQELRHGAMTMEEL